MFKKKGMGSPNPQMKTSDVSLLMYLHSLVRMFLIKKWEFWKICALAPRFVIFAGILPRMWNFSKTFSGSIDWFLIWISINLWTLSKFQIWLYFVLNFGNNLVFFCGKIIFFSFRGSRSMIDPMMKNIFWTRRKWSKQTDAHSKLKFIFMQFWHFSKNGARS